MSGSPPTARFRLRREDGTEVLVSSVEALARRVQRGDILPHTPLFDGSTGVWCQAAAAPVVRFILEDIASEGEAVPPEWNLPPAVVDDDGPWRKDPGPGAPPESPPGAVEIRSGGTDPLDFGITPAQDPGGEGGGDDAEVPGTDSPAGARRRDAGAWLTHVGADPVGDGQPPAEADSRPDAAWDAAPTTLPPTPRQDRPTAPAPAPREAARPHSRSQRRMVVIAVAGGLAVAAVGTFFGGGPGEPDDSAADFGSGAQPGGAGLVSVAAAAASQPAPPTDLATRVELVLARFATRIDATVDSLRALHQVGGAPPPQWLSGPYLADAGRFPTARTFWVGYEGLLRDLQIRDRPIFYLILDEAVAQLPDDTGDAERLREYLEGRYARMAPPREDRIRQLIEAAQRAIALHDFLEGASSDLRFTPALGSAVPRDPVLEVGTDNPATLRALNTHLDELFGALDRSRGGGALSQGGLRADLFLGFGVL